MERCRGRASQRSANGFSVPQKLSDESEVNLEIVLPTVSNTCPRVYAKGIEGKAPHQWSDGALCLYGVAVGVESRANSILSTLALGRSWLKHYDAWRKAGKWPMEEDSQMNDDNFLLVSLNCSTWAC